MQRLVQPTVWDRIRNAFFYSNAATGVSVIALFFLGLGLVFLVEWGFLDAVFRADSEACYQARGA
ncbi:MAG: hypothetical protein ACI4SV_02855, partial [Duodenibacillus sp.]